MKLNNLKKCLITILGGALFCIVFSACDNFLNSKDVAKEIQNAIDYNNSITSHILLKAVPNTGEFLSDGEKDCKEGYAIDVQFTLNSKDYVYRGMKAISKTDETKDLSDYVQFTDKSTELEKNNGIYKVQIKLIKSSNDIMIRPDCVLIPKVVSITPVFNPQGFEQDEIIKIQFNKSVDPLTFKDFQTLSIYSDTEDLKENYFSTPYFSNNNTILNIPPIQDKYILAPDSNKKLDITVSIDFTNIKDIDGIPIEQNSPYKYRINDSFGNQVKSSFLLRSEGIGQFDKEGELESSVGFGMEVSFRLDTSKYYFAGLEAHSRDKSQNRTDIVSFSEVSRDDQTGNYLIRVIITQENNDVLITPKCLPLPAVESYIPSSSTQNQYANTPINILFNMPMTCDFVYDQNILLTSGQVSVSSFFEPPVLSQDKRTLTITPLAPSLMAFLKERGQAVMEVNITLTDGISIEKEGLCLDLAQNEKSSFKISYQAQVESVSPECVDFFITQKEMTLETVNTITQKFTNENISSKQGFTEEEFAQKVMQNLTRDTVYIYGCYYDEDSGVKSVEVNELLTNDAQYGDTVYEVATNQIYTAQSETAQFVTENGQTRFCIKHQIKQKNGPVRLVVTVKDACENPSEAQTYYAIKKDVINNNGGGIGGSLSNTHGIDSSTWSSFAPEAYSQNIKTISFSMVEAICGPLEDTTNQVYMDVVFPQDAYTVLCEYIDKNGNNCKEAFTPQPNEYDYQWDITLNVASLFDFSFKVIVKDILGNYAEREVKIPTMNKDDVLPVYRYSDSKVQVELYDSDTHKSLYHKCHLVRKDNAGNFSITSASGYMSLLPSYTYYVIPGDYYLSGEMINDFELTSADYDSTYEMPAKIEITSAQIVDTQDPNYVDMVLSLQNDQYYDYLLTDSSKVYTWNKENHTMVGRYAVKELKEPSNPTYHGISIYGFVGNRQQSSQSYTLPWLPSADLVNHDIVAPEFDLYDWHFYNKEYEGKLCYIIRDEISGPKQGSLTIKDLSGKVIKTYIANESTNYAFRIPVYEVMPLMGSFYTFDYQIEDNAGNIATGSHNPQGDINYINHFTFITRQSNGELIMSLDIENLYGGCQYPNAEFYKLSTSGSNCNWLTSSISVENQRQNILDNEIYLYRDDYTQERVDSIKDFIKSFGIPEDCISEPKLKFYKSFYNEDQADDFISQLITAEIPDEVIEKIQNANSSNYKYTVIVNDFFKPQSYTIDSFKTKLGEVGVNDFISVHISIDNASLIPKNPYKQYTAYEKIVDSSYDNCFVKMAAAESGGAGRIMNSVIFYNGTPGTGEFDWLRQNGNAKDYVFVSSDAPVYMHTLVTNIPYEQCKNWSSQEWLSFKRSIGDLYYSFSDQKERRYSVPINDIEKGFCYVVAAHFSDGHIELSDVFER